jgi:type IV pilus assembly protein PilA
MVQKLRERSRGEGGFTLVELLVVMLILGLLAAIAIPSFFNQRDKARDADAKAAARTAQTAIETYATDNQGSYADATAADLQGIEETLSGAALAVGIADGSGTAAADNQYRVTVTSDTGNTFWISRADGSGVVELECQTAENDGCPADNDGDTFGNWGG